MLDQRAPNASYFVTKVDFLLLQLLLTSLDPVHFWVCECYRHVYVYASSVEGNAARMAVVVCTSILCCRPVCNGV